MGIEASIPIPDECEGTLQRLLGERRGWTHASVSTRSWEEKLQALILQLERHIAVNADSDVGHEEMIAAELEKLKAGAKGETREVRTVLGLLRLCYCLMGDLPDYRDKDPRGVKPRHRMLDRYRSVTYHRSVMQKASYVFDRFVQSDLEKRRPLPEDPYPEDPEERKRIEKLEELKWLYQTAESDKNSIRAREFLEELNRSFPEKYSELLPNVRSRG